MITLENARKWYSSDDAVHGFDHIERVYLLCEKIGPPEGADMEILLTAALLHDVTDSHPGGEGRKNHHMQSAEFAESVLIKENWVRRRIQAIQHCIRAHRFRKGEAPKTIEAKVLFDADKLDVIGAIGVTRALAYAFQAKQPAYSNPSKKFMESGIKEEGESHSAYHEYIFKLNKISGILITKTAKRIAEHRQAYLNDFFEMLAEEMKNLK
jgi:uncharacterized protein